MPYRLPLELELTILELAAPPLAIDSLHDRVDFFIKISLVHRSLTAWAQGRLHDQFLYTYQPRPYEHERLKKRFEAGFSRDRPLRRLYLDWTRLPSDVYRRKGCSTDSVSDTVHKYACRRISPVGASGSAEQGGTSAEGTACKAVAHYRYSWGSRDKWGMCAMITSYSQVLDTLWLRPRSTILNIKNLPRALTIQPASTVI